MKGISTCDERDDDAGLGEHEGDRRARSAPSAISALLTTPVSPPNSSAQPSVRATTEISSGPRMTSRKMPRQRARHAVEDVGLGRADHGADEGHARARCANVRRNISRKYGSVKSSCQFFRMKTGLDALRAAEVVERQQHRHGQRNDDARPRTAASAGALSAVGQASRASASEATAAHAQRQVHALALFRRRLARSSGGSPSPGRPRCRPGRASGCPGRCGCATRAGQALGAGSR